MTAEPKISVVIVTYNFGKYLGECIESILAQTLKPFEIVICDDRSTDGSWETISEYERRYPELIKPHRHERNIGPSPNANSGLKRASGDFVAWIDGDDRWLPRKLELEWLTLKSHPDAKIAYSNVYVINDKGKRTGVWYGGEGSQPPGGDVFIEVFSRRFFPHNPSVFRNHLMYRTALEEVGYKDEELESYMDWDLKIRLTSRFRVAYSGEALVEYRIHGGGFHRQQPEKHLRAMIAAYKKNLPLLDDRSEMEAAQVKCRIEGLAAMTQGRLPLSQHMDWYSARRVYDRNRVLLDRLRHNERAVLEKALSPLLKQLIEQTIQEEVEKGNRAFALKYWINSLRRGRLTLDPKTAARVLLPRHTYEMIKNAYLKVRHVQS